MSPLTPLSHFMEVAYLLIAWPASEIEPSATTVFGDTGDFVTIHALISLQSSDTNYSLIIVYAAAHFILAFCILTILLTRKIQFHFQRVSSVAVDLFSFYSFCAIQ